MNLDYEVPINDASEIRVEEYLKANKISKFVAINFFGASKRRKFKVSKAIDLLGKIQKKYPEYKIIILNSPKDKKTILSIMKIMKENNIYYVYNYVDDTENSFTEEELFDWIYESPYMNTTIYSFDKLKTSDAKRDKKRKFYCRWLDYLKTKPKKEYVGN